MRSQKPNEDHAGERGFRGWLRVANHHDESILVPTNVEDDAIVPDEVRSSIDYYRNQGKLRLIDGARPPEMVAAALDEVIRPLVGADGAPNTRPTPS